MEWNWVDILVVLLSLGNLGAFVWVVLSALKIKNGPVAAATDRVKPMIAQGKAIAEVGKQKASENQTRIQALLAELKGIYEKVKPAADGARPEPAINFRTIMTAFSVLSTLRRGLMQLRQVRKPTSNPPGPVTSKKKSLPRRLGTVSMIPDILRVIMEIRRVLSRA